MTGRWTVVAPGRASRPRDTRVGPDGCRPSFDGDCPFCPGNEQELPRILWELPSEAPPGWQVRAVPNRYPAFTAGAAGPLRAGPARGSQEVIIETPRHDREPGSMAPAEMEAVVEAYHARYMALAGAHPERHVILFRNRGAEAGNTLVHAHAQLYAVDGPVPEVDARNAEAERHHRAEGTCVLCALPGTEPDWDARTVAANRSFTAVVPWAAVASLEMWIVPRVHQASFGQTTAGQRRDLAELLGVVLERLRVRAGDPAYNAMWHGGRLTDAGARHLHWSVQVRPKISRPAGFELASGVDICPSDPVADAALLR